MHEQCDARLARAGIVGEELRIGGSVLVHAGLIREERQPPSTDQANALIEQHRNPGANPLRPVRPGALRIGSGKWRAGQHQRREESSPPRR